MAESGGRTDAHNPSGEDSWGLFQINVDPDVRENRWGDLTDPVVNARAAFELSGNGTNLRPWTVTHDSNKGTNKDYRNFMEEARAAGGGQYEGNFLGVEGYRGEPSRMPTEAAPDPPDLPTTDGPAGPTGRGRPSPGPGLRSGRRQRSLRDVEGHRPVAGRQRPGRPDRRVRVHDRQQRPGRRQRRRRAERRLRGPARLEPAADRLRWRQHHRRSRADRPAQSPGRGGRSRDRHGRRRRDRRRRDGSPHRSQPGRHRLRRAERRGGGRRRLQPAPRRHRPRRHGRLDRHQRRRCPRPHRRSRSGRSARRPDSGPRPGGCRPRSRLGGAFRAGTVRRRARPRGTDGARAADDGGATGDAGPGRAGRADGVWPARDRNVRLADDGHHARRCPRVAPRSHGHGRAGSARPGPAGAVAQVRRRRPVPDRRSLCLGVGGRQRGRQPRRLRLLRARPVGRRPHRGRHARRLVAPVPEAQGTGSGHPGRGGGEHARCAPVQLLQRAHAGRGTAQLGTRRHQPG